MEQRFLASNHHTQSAKILRDDPVAEGDLHHNELDQQGGDADHVHGHTGVKGKSWRNKEEH